MAVGDHLTMPAPAWVWGVPLAPVTSAQAVDLIDGLVAARRPSAVITANLHYAMVSSRDARLRDYNSQAALIVADGMPLVWASRWRSRHLPERVAGADLVPALCERAAERGYGIYLFGAGPGVADDAAKKLRHRFPGLRIVGAASPPYGELTSGERMTQLDAIRRTAPDLLFVALGQPKGEFWVAENYRALGVPVTIQIGAALDFAAGTVGRAPRWMQRTGLEWVYRLLREPGRLSGRYACNGWFALRMMVRDLFTRRANRR